MEEVLMTLIEAALAQQTVVAQELTNGMQMLVYPMDDGLMVGIGYESYAAHKVRPEQMVHKRSEDVRRFSAWHPAMMANGGLYVVRRLRRPGMDRHEPLLSEDELLAAEELLT